MATSRPIAAMRNLGPATARMLAEIDIRSEQDLRALGAVGAFARLRFACIPGLSLNALYAMHAALNDIHWRAMSADAKASLRSEVERALEPIPR